MELAVLSLSFLLFLVLGVPVAFAIGLSCLATFAVEGLPLATAMQMMVSGMNVFSFLAIPFFIFSGELMLHGGIADKILDFARSLVGHMKGGLGLANVMASTLFGFPPMFPSRRFAWSRLASGSTCRWPPSRAKFSAAA